MLCKIYCSIRKSPVSPGSLRFQCEAPLHVIGRASQAEHSCTKPFSSEPFVSIRNPTSFPRTCASTLEVGHVLVHFPAGTNQRHATSIPPIVSKASNVSYLTDFAFSCGNSDVPLVAHLRRSIWLSVWSRKDHIDKKKKNSSSTRVVQGKICVVVATLRCNLHFWKIFSSKTRSINCCCK